VPTDNDFRIPYGGLCPPNSARGPGGVRQSSSIAAE